MKHPTCTTRIALLAALALLAGPSTMVPPARADQVIDVHLEDKVPAGKRPGLIVSVFRDLSGLVLDLKRDDGKTVHRRIDNVPHDAKRTFDLPGDAGKHRYRGTLTVIFTGGERGEMNLDFEVEVVPGLGLAVRPDDLDLEARTLLLRSRRPVARLAYTVIGEDGSVLGKDDVAFSEPHAPVRLGWKQRDGKVLKIELVAVDPDGIREPLVLIPWRYHIPHQEVEFETGKWDIRPTERHKLEDSYRLLQEGIRKYGKLLDVKLYIAGYTDTVAAADYNQKLSGKRALAIARYFRDKGFRDPIFYQGFGERGLKVPTPDETDEPRNRRAEYVLAAEPPGLDVPGADARWRRLR